MSSAVIFLQWESYQGGANTPPFFVQEPLAFNSRQERLHSLSAGDWLWLVSRCPEDQQYYFVAALQIAGQKRNAPESTEGKLYGEFAVLVDRSRSHDLGTRLPAEGLLRAFEFETCRTIKYGASLGQSLQTLRVLNPNDERALAAALQRTLAASAGSFDAPCGLWTKCDRVFADYFFKNWQERKAPLAFLLYDPPPALPPGAPVFIHSDKTLRLVASFRGGQFVAGHKPTVEKDERLAERERVWLAYRASTVNPPAKSDFDKFWEGQNGIRGLFLMDNLTPLPAPPPFKAYGRALQWGYPMGVGYRYLTFSQSYLLVRLAGIEGEAAEVYLGPMLGAGRAAPQRASPSA
jgi:hypothetical protein